MKSLILPTLLLGLAAIPQGQDSPAGFPTELPEDPNLHPKQIVEVEAVPEQRRLLEEVGTWNASIRSFLYPGMPPVESKGVLTSEMLGDGWLVSKFVGSVLGEQLHFQRTVGFDPKTKRALGVLIDPNATNVAVLEGTYDMDRRKRILTYSLVDTNGKRRDYKSIEKTVDAETRYFYLFEITESTEEVPLLKIDYSLVAR